ncbi:MAG TPA: hypothetical protein VNO33_18390 [Kofleriaceae bacterium]|nr:hypothetical protein [Kofleriaceae bacterium]
MADPQFAGRHSTVETVDVLPVDLQVWTMPGHRRDPEALLRELEPEIGGMLAAQLARRGYQVVAQLDRSGRYTAPDGVVRSAMPQDDLARTSYALSSYGRAQSELDGQLLVPFLPARLGAATGSDATLYVGGWAFAGKERGSSKAAKVVKTILIVGLIAVVVVAVIAGIKGDGGPGKAVGKVAEGAGRVAVGTARVAGRVVGGLARTTGHVAHAVLREPELFHLTVETIDAFARTGTHVEVYSARPDYYAEGPRDGRSAMMLEMTLIDNRTGRALWHARQRFPASPVRAQEVERAVTRLMSSLPAQ